MQQRLDWTQYFMQLAFHVATRSTCIRRQVGAVAADANHNLIGTGYNGAPSKMTHCTKETCIRTKQHIPSGTQLDICKAIHAEQNLVIRHGLELEGATVYCTTRPCTTCTKLLIGCRVQEIVWKNNYDDEYAKQLLKEYTNSDITVDEYGYYHIAKEVVSEQEDDKLPDWPADFANAYPGFWTYGTKVEAPATHKVEVKPDGSIIAEPAEPPADKESESYNNPWSYLGDLFKSRKRS